MNSTGKKTKGALDFWGTINRLAYETRAAESKISVAEARRRIIFEFAVQQGITFAEAERISERPDDKKSSPKQFSVSVVDAAYLVDVLGRELEGIEERISDCGLPQNADFRAEKKALVKEKALVESLIVRLGGAL